MSVSLADNVIEDGSKNCNAPCGFEMILGDISVVLRTL